MKRIAILVLAALAASAPAVFAQDTTAIDTTRAREDYRAYLRKLKELSAQYKQFTGELSKVMKEEGFPTLGQDGTGSALPEVNFPYGDVRVDESGRDELKVEVDIPGLKKNSLDVRVQDEKRLRVAGRRKANDEHVERFIDLPVAVVGDDADARYEDGVLTVRLKKAPQNAKEVAIKVE